jgi:hypothetical protein
MAGETDPTMKQIMEVAAYDLSRWEQLNAGC